MYLHVYTPVLRFRVNNLLTHTIVSKNRGNKLNYTNKTNNYLLTNYMHLADYSIIFAVFQHMYMTVRLFV